MGRPRTTLAKLPKDWRDKMNAIAGEGGSDIEIKCALGIGWRAWDTLKADSEEFRDAVKEAQALCQ